jgi:microsomal dipeptidase-like Zn-dependent dipeptidase
MIRTAAASGTSSWRPRRYLLGRTAADLRAAKASGRLACMDVEGVQALGPQVSLVEFFYDIGVRWMLMVYNRASPPADADPEDEGSRM